MAPLQTSTNRRAFLKKMFASAGILIFGPRFITACSSGSDGSGSRDENASDDSVRDPDQPIAPTDADLYRAVNGSPAENMNRIVEMMGGIDALIGADDIVILKPNVQWWNQGATNLAAVKAFVDLAQGRVAGGQGEVVIAENCHRGATPWTAGNSGWSRPFVRNSDLSGIRHFNDLCDRLKSDYGERFSVIHLLDANAGGERIYSADQGPGYIYCDGTGGVPLLAQDNGAGGSSRRATVMTYPVFVTDAGTMVDFKDGVYDRSGYTGQPVKFINFSALNHHSHYCGVTAAIKNYLGISDLSGGADPFADGKLTSQYYNFHSFPFNEWQAGPVPGMIGAEVGMFMRTVRQADINITTAEWIGLSSRTDPPAVQTRAILASSDPVALDFHSSRYLLYPNSGNDLHDPMNESGPLSQYLKACAEKMGGAYHEDQVTVRSYDVAAGRFQEPDELEIRI